MELLRELLTESNMSVGDVATKVANELTDRYGYYTDDEPVVRVHDRESASVSWDGPESWTQNDPYYFHEELVGMGLESDYKEDNYQPFYDEVAGFEMEPYDGYTLMIRKA